MAREKVRVAYRFIIPQGGGMYLMQSRKRPETVWHMCDINDGCSCEDAQANGNPNCGHKKFLNELAAQGRLPHQGNVQV